jgi:hypothetical protein
MGGAVAGVIGVLVAAIGWGSNFVVVKGFKMHDGFAFQFWLCQGILLVGLGTAFASAPAPGYAPGAGGKFGELEVTLSLLGVLGGALWCLGNLLTVEIINAIGLGLGVAIWGGCNLLTAFVVGRVPVCLGTECLQVAPLQSAACGGIGCALSVCALLLFSQVDTSIGPMEDSMLPGGGTAGSSMGQTAASDAEATAFFEGSRWDRAPTAAGLQNYEPSSQAQLLDRLSQALSPEHMLWSERVGATKLAKTGKRRRRSRGILLAVLAGVIYGFQFLPEAIYMQQPDHGGSAIKQMRFFFSQYVGTFLMSTLAYAGYAAQRGCARKPPAEVPLTAMLPSILSGVVWAFGGAGAMFATDGLGYSVGFPLVLNGSFLVNVLWSVLYFKEIRGRRDLTLFAAAAGLTVIGSILIAVSK